MNAKTLIFSVLKLPHHVRRNIVAHFIKRFFGLQSTNHETIWTSFLYFSIKYQAAITESKGIYKVMFYLDGKQIQTHIRGGQSSDIFAFFQVFIADGYEAVREIMTRKMINPKVIIDAGANVGYFTLLMSQGSQNLLIAIEPEASNYDLLVKNIEINKLSDTCKPMHNALWTNKQRLGITMKSGSEWAVRVGEDTTSQSCLSLSLFDIVADFSLYQIDLLKMDVEGTEEVLFQNEQFVKSLGIVKIIAMEIHDKIANRERINETLRENNFDFLEKGELTIAWNKGLVNA